MAVQARRHERGQAGQYETQLQAADGRQIPALVSARPLYKEGQFDGVLAVFTDISALKAAQEELRASEAKAAAAYLGAAFHESFVNDMEGNGRGDSYS